MATSFGRLANAVSSAAGSLDTLDSQISALGGVFSGQGGAIRAPSLAEGLNHNGPEFARAVGQITGPLGSSGNQLSEALMTGNRLENILPSVLGKLAGSPLETGETMGEKSKSLLISQLGGQDAVKKLPELGRAIEVISAGLGELETK